MAEHVRFSLRARVRGFRLPPVHDALLVGKDAPIRTGALRQALSLVSAECFDELPFESDEVIDVLLVRSSLLRRIPPERLRRFVLERVKPLMAAGEVVRLDLEPEVELEGRV